MTTITLHKALARPVAPTGSHGLYMENIKAATPYIAYRVYTAANGGANHVGLAELEFTPHDQSTGAAFASSVHSSGSYNADQVVDGNLATGWSTNNTNNGLPAYIGILYPSAVVVNQVILTALNNTEAYGSTPIGLIIQASNDTTDGHDGTWVDLYTEATSPTWSNSEVRNYALVAPTASASASHIGWRIKIHTNGGYSKFQMAELSFTGATGIDTSFASDVFNTYTPDKLIDGLLGISLWSSTSATDGITAGILYTTPQPATHVVITSVSDAAGYPSAPVSFDIEYSDDTTDGADGTWVLTDAITGSTGWGNEEVRSYPITAPTISSVVHLGWRVKMINFPAGRANNKGGFAEVVMPIGGTAFASSVFEAATNADKAFDNDTATQWNTLDGGDINGFVGRVYGAPTELPSPLSLTATPSGIYTPTSFIVQYSDDTTTGLDGTWIDHLTVSDAATWGDTETRSYTLPGLLNYSLGIHVTTLDGSVVVSIPDSDTISSLGVGGAGGGHTLRVADIAARDALALGFNRHIVVDDASADPDVESGSAIYFFDPISASHTRVGGNSDSICIETEEW